MASLTIAASSGTENNNTPFKTSLQLQTPKPTTASVTAAINDALQNVETDPNEARYWMHHYGLGTHAYQRSFRQFAHPRKLLLKPTAAGSENASSFVVQQIVMAPVGGEHSTNSKLGPLAVVGGPRVYLYGTSATSAMNRHLSRHTVRTEISTQVVSADRMVQTNGRLALAADYRSDGRLLAVGTHVGEVRVCDVTMRATLATFGGAAIAAAKGSTASSPLPIRAVAWFRNGQNILSAGDDGVVRVWSLSGSSSSSGALASLNGKALLELRGHGDAIRAALLWQQPTTATTTAWNQLAFSGSYDHTVRVWNVQLAEGNLDNINQQDRCLAVLNHGAPVEALLTMPSTNPKVPVWLLSAGGVTLKVWNPMTGECIMTVTTQHRKTITTLTPIVRRNNSDDNDSNTIPSIPSWRIVTGSLDGCLRIHTWSSQTGTIQHIHGFQVGQGDPITAFCCSGNGDRLAIGTSNGMVFLRQRGPSINQHKRKRPPPAGTYAFFTRGQNTSYDMAAASANGDYLLADGGGGGGSSSALTGTNNAKKRKLRKYDLCLKQFRYGDALDEAMETRMPSVVVAVLEELGKRRGLTIALSNRDEESLEPVLSFLVRYVTKPRYSCTLIGVAHMVIDIYGDVAGQSETIDELFVKLKNQIREEIEAQKSLLRLIGQLDAVGA